MEPNLSPQGRLGMLDEVGHRKFIIPAEVQGRFHSAKRNLHFLLLCFFLAVPWLSINGRQLLLFNIPQRRFFFFGMELFAHDTPLVFFLIMIFAIGLAIMTALFGRIWCGWACPQTVFIEFLYRKIEIWVEGNYLARRKLREEDMSFKKFSKIFLKWLLFLIVSSLIAHSFIAYFTGSKELLSMMSGSPTDNFSYFVMVSVATAVLLFNFGWFREQFCVIACPYGKFQSVLMDQQTITVMYDDKRGEPRKGTVPTGAQRGDCVSCQRCVQVCPTKIDIRNGIQLECIGCTACMDACDDIMKKVNKPAGLIRYKAISDRPINWFRSRIVLYASILIFCSAGFSYLLATSEPFRIEILRAHSEPYRIRKTEASILVQNHFNLRIENHFSTAISVTIESENKVNLILPENPMQLGPEQKRDIPLFIEIVSDELINGKKEIILTMNQGKKKYSRKVVLIGPTNSQ